MSRFIAVPCIILMLGIRMPMAAETELDEGTMDGAKGFGIGALVGGLVGGPVGAIVGAAGGAFFAEQDAGKDRTIDGLEVKLDQRDAQLAELRTDFEENQVAMTGGATVLPGSPKAPISLPVYFRTGAATVEDSLRPHLAQLVAYLEAYPELGEAFLAVRVPHDQEVPALTVGAAGGLEGDLETLLENLGCNGALEVEALAHRTRGREQVVAALPIHRNLPGAVLAPV